jgi:hypothetical protein
MRLNQARHQSCAAAIDELRRLTLEGRAWLPDRLDAVAFHDDVAAKRRSTGTVENLGVGEACRERIGRRHGVSPEKRFG